MGGSVNAIEEGFIQNEIARSAYEHQRKVEKMRRSLLA
jgi:methylmalonyl-CoA mutase N-terminal domain/subunit